MDVEVEADWYSGLQAVLGVSFRKVSCFNKSEYGKIRQMVEIFWRQRRRGG